VISLRDRLVEDQAARRREAAQRPPVIFFVGVVMMTSVLGVLMLQAVTHGKSAAAAAGSPYGTLSAQPAATLTHSPTPAPTVAPYLGLTGYVWPLEKPVITLPFGPSDWGDFFDNGVRIHDGVDIASNCGDNVLAAHDGVVLAAGRQYDDYMGWIGSVTPYYNLLTTKKGWNSLPIVVIIDDGDGYRSIYAHEEQLFVKVGQRVKAGDRIGLEGATGNASGCHVHFGLFSPKETAAFQLDPAIVSKDLLPTEEIARINPLLVLPFGCQFEEMRSLRPIEAAPCPPLPTASPSGKASLGASTTS